MKLAGIRPAYRRELLEEASLKRMDAVHMLSDAARELAVHGKEKRARRVEMIGIAENRSARALLAEADKARIEDTNRVLPGAYAGF